MQPCSFFKPTYPLLNATTLKRTIDGKYLPTTASSNDAPKDQLALRFGVEEDPLKKLKKVIKATKQVTDQVNLDATVRDIKHGLGGADQPANPDEKKDEEKKD